MSFTANDGILIVVITYALYTDLKSGYIYNHLTFPAMAIGIALNSYLFGIAGLKNSLLGLALGYALLAIPYFVGWQGAGDVKLLMATGAIEGWRILPVAFIFYMIASFFLSILFILVKIITRGKEGRDFLTRLGIMVGFGLQISSETDKEMLKSDIKWSPALFVGIIIALYYLRSLK